MMVRAISLAIAGLLLFSGGEASAELAVGLLPPTLEGELTGAETEDFEEAIAEQLRSDGFQVRSSSDLAESAGLDREALSSCSATCLETIFEDGTTHAVIRSVIEGNLNTYLVRLEVLSPAGARLEELENICDLCSRAEAVLRLGEVTADLTSRLARVVTLRLDLTPADMTVTLDDAPIHGPSVTVEPGPHRLTFEAEGFVPVERELRAVLGEEPVITLALQPTAGDDPEPELPRPGPMGPMGPMGISGIVLMVSGGLALAAGVGTLTIDGDCANEVFDAFGNCEMIYSTLAGSAVSIAAGGAALITGAILLILDFRRRRTEPPSLAPTSAALEALDRQIAQQLF